MKYSFPFPVTHLFSNKSNSARFTRWLLACGIVANTIHAAAQPVITGFSPQKANPGTTITITGSGFNSTPANNKVYFGGVRGSVAFATPTSIGVTVPVGARYDAVSVNNTVSALTGYSVYPFLPTFNNTAFVPGNINFNPSAAFFSMSNANVVTIGDVDVDGKPDVIVTDDAHTVSVFRNISTSGTITPGSFAPKVDFNTGTNPYGLLLKDIDGDNKPDIIVANSGAGTVSVLRNASSVGSITSASFVAKVDFTVGTNPANLAITDVNGDGKPELIVTNNGTNTVSVLENTSIVGAITSTSFAPKVDFTTAASPRALTVTDMDGDGKADIVTGTGYQISILRNVHTTGAISGSSFDSHVDFTTHDFSDYMAVADIDGDGMQDVVTGSLDMDVSVFRNTAVPGAIDAGSLALPVHFALDGTYMHMADLAIADIDGDSKPDITFLTINYADWINRVVVMRNTSTSGTVTAASFSAGVNFNLEINATYNTRLCIGDIDGDTRPDLVLTNKDFSTVNILRNSPQLLTPVAAPVVSSLSASSANPGTAIIISGSNFNTTPANNYVFFGSVKATVTAATSSSLSVQVPTGATYQPVAVNNANTNLTGYSRQPFLPTFPDCAALQSILAFDNGEIIGGSTSRPAIGDLNGDGKDEIIHTTNGVPSNQVLVYQNNGTAGSITSGSFAAPISLNTVGSVVSTKIGDIDGDGKPDIVYLSDVDQSVYYPRAIGVIRNKSTGGPLTSASFDNEVNSYYNFDASIASANDFYLADIDGDGRLDVVVATTTGFSVLRNNSVPGFATPGLFADPVTFLSGPVTTSSCAVADIDGDGKPDVIVGYNSGNSFSVFRNTSGLGPITSSSFAAPVSFSTPAGKALLKVADIDKDGKPDIVTVNSTANSISIFQNTASAGAISSSSFAARLDIAAPTAPQSVSVADMDGGGTADLVVSNNSSCSIYRNTATGGGPITATTFAAPANFTTGMVYDIADLDGDSKPDLLTNNGAFDLMVVRNNRMCGTPITGSPGLCPAGGTTTLGNINPGGTWTSSDPSVATVDASSGIVTGGTTGTAVISYAFPPGAYNTISGFTATIVVTVEHLPDAGTVSGMAAICAGTTTALSASVTGGSWSSVATGIATVNSSGTVTGVAAGTTTISYAVTNGCGTVAATQVVTINALPSAGTITGTANVCVAATASLSNTATGGTWSSSNTSVATVGSGTGIVTGVAPGTAVISYIITNDCGLAYTIKNITVNPLPFAGTVTGTASVCEASSVTFADAAPGGVWISGTPSVASVSSSGLVTGVSAGTSAISYAVITGCGIDVAIKIVTVNALPVAGTIIGASSVCPAEFTTLGNAAIGGSWSSGATVIATVSGTGIVTGISAGTAVISYTVTNGCGTAITTHIMTVNPLPDADVITGTASFCVGAGTTLSDAAPGGIWSSSLPVVATVSSTGDVSGTIAGMAIISYSVTNSCGTAMATLEVTVDPTADAGEITGSLSVCEGSTTTLSNAVTGGTWNSADAGIASISTAGIVTGVVPGTAVISYTFTNVCGSDVATVTVTVNALADAGAITGTPIVCEGATTVLSDLATGGTWSSGSAAHATVNISGLVTGVALGTATISYSLTNVCSTDIVTATVTINPLPHAAAVTGIDSVCVGDSVMLSDATLGGTWSSGNPAVAVVTSTGIVIGLSAGTADISYHLTNSCGTDHAVLPVHVRSMEDCTTGVNTIAGNMPELSIYPNPTSGAFTVRAGEQGRLALYTLTGQELQSYTVAKGSNAFNLPSGIAAGVYMCRFYGQSGNITTMRLVYE